MSRDERLETSHISSSSRKHNTWCVCDYLLVVVVVVTHAQRPAQISCSLKQDFFLNHHFWEEKNNRKFDWSQRAQNRVLSGCGHFYPLSFSIGEGYRRVEEEDGPHLLLFLLLVLNKWKRFFSLFFFFDFFFRKKREKSIPPFSLTVDDFSSGMLMSSEGAKKKNSYCNDRSSWVLSKQQRFLLLFDVDWRAA